MRRRFERDTRPVSSGWTGCERLAGSSVRTGESRGPEDGRFQRARVSRRGTVSRTRV